MRDCKSERKKKQIMKKNENDEKKGKKNVDSLSHSELFGKLVAALIFRLLSAICNLWLWYTQSNVYVILVEFERAHKICVH